MLTCRVPSILLITPGAKRLLKPLFRLYLHSNCGENDSMVENQVKMELEP
jgi:hypothetical protein